MNRLRLASIRIGAFIRREFLFQWSYKFAFVYRFGSLFGTLLVLFFVGRLFTDRQPQALASYDTDYFTFALIGMAFLDFMNVSMRTFAQQIRMAQFMGTLEAMMATPISAMEILVFSSAYAYLWAILRTAVFLAVGVFVLSADLNDVNFLSAAIFVLLMIVAFAGIGLTAAALTLYLKQSDPVTGLISGISFLFGGIVYPVQVLPDWARAISWCLPMTHAVEGIRRAFLLGAGPGELMFNAAVLGTWAVISMITAVFVLRMVLSRMSRDGSFGAY